MYFTLFEQFSVLPAQVIKVLPQVPVKRLDEEPGANRWMLRVVDKSIPNSSATCDILLQLTAHQSSCVGAT
jgi:hypothetical protein